MFKLRVNDLEIPVYAQTARSTLGQDNMYKKHSFVGFDDETVIRTFIGLAYAENGFISEASKTVPGYQSAVTDLIDSLKIDATTTEHQ